MSVLGVEHFYDKDTGTLTYLVYCPATKAAAIIDPVLDFDIKACRSTTASADAVLAKALELGLRVDWILETHVHADHLTSSRYLKGKLTRPDGTAPPVCIGAHIVDVLQFWVPVFNVKDAPLDGTQFDRLFADGDEFAIGNVTVRVMYTPGHTPACITYLVPDAGCAFVGDTIFNPEMGNARADFPGGSPATLFASARKLLALGDDFKLYVGHDYPEAGAAVPCAPVRDHRAKNCTLNDRVTEAEFVAANSDKMPVPRLLLPSLQVNLRAGCFGEPESNGKRYVKLPVNTF